MTEHVVYTTALNTMEEADKRRLTFKNPEKYGLLCLWQSDGHAGVRNKLWAVVSMKVLEAMGEGA